MTEEVLRFNRIEDNIDGKQFITADFIMEVENVRMISSNGSELPVYAKGDTAQTDIETAVIEPETGLSNIFIYPNSANGFLNIEFRDIRCLPRPP